MKTLRTHGTLPNGMNFNLEFVFVPSKVKGNTYLDVKLYADGIFWDVATNSYGVLRTFEEAFEMCIDELERKQGIDLIIEKIEVEQTKL
jgi:hypothetical protein